MVWFDMYDPSLSMSRFIDRIGDLNFYLYRSDCSAASFAGKVKTRLNCIELIQNLSMKTPARRI